MYEFVFLDNFQNFYSFLFPWDRLFAFFEAKEIPNVDNRKQMKASDIVLLSTLLIMVLVIGMLCAGIVGFFYLGSKAWEKGWAKGDAITAPDGYTYCVMYETGIGQDPYTKLIRSRNLDDEKTYEDLGSVNEVSSWLTVIRPIEVANNDKPRLCLTSNNLVFCVSFQNDVAFVYDPVNNIFYGGEDAVLSPFILIDKEDTELYKPDIVKVISRTAKTYREKPEWPTADALQKGLNHPNKEVQKISKWLLEIQKYGLSADSETMKEVKYFLNEN